MTQETTADFKNGLCKDYEDFKREYDLQLQQYIQRAEKRIAESKKD